MSFDARLLSGIGVMIAVVDRGGFARAGDELGLTPSGVSRAIARLEAQLGVRLFHRTPRLVELTEEGRRFHAEVSPLLAAIQDAAEGAGAATVHVRGRLKVNTDPWFARVILAPRLPELLRLHPELQLEFVVSNHREEMMHGGVDVAVRFGSPPDSAMIARKLLETRVVTCAAPAYLARRGIPQSPADVVQHDVLLFRDPETGRPFPWEFHRAGETVTTRVKGRVVIDDPSAALAACEAGGGLFQSFESGLAPWLSDGRLTQVLTDWPRSASRSTPSIPRGVRRRPRCAPSSTSWAASAGWKPLRVSQCIQHRNADKTGDGLQTHERFTTPARQSTAGVW